MRDQRSLKTSEEDEESSEANISNEKLSCVLNLRDIDFGEDFFAANAGGDYHVEEFPIPDESIENLYSQLVQRRRRRLYAMMQGKGSDDICIKPIKKIGRGENVFFASSLDSIFNRRDMRDFRGSKYRGISKNGSSWQILVMINRKKRYVGKLPSEIHAARFYDLVSIQYQGDLAKCNFPYNKREVLQLLRISPLLE
jgi:hypothetical protein